MDDNFTKISWLLLIPKKVGIIYVGSLTLAERLREFCCIEPSVSKNFETDEIASRNFMITYLYVY